MITRYLNYKPCKKFKFLKQFSPKDIKNNEKMKSGNLPIFTVVWNETDAFSFKVSV